MSKQREALQMALELLETNFTSFVEWAEKIKIVRLKIRETLAEPEQEPVAWLSINFFGERYLSFVKPKDRHPPVPLYDAPSTRKPLTDEELFALRDAYAGHLKWGVLDFARAIERAHGIGE